MQKTFLFKNPLFLFIVLLLFIASCNNNDSAPAKTDGEDNTEKTDMTVVDTDSAKLNDYLNILSIEAANFPKKGNRLTFRFYDTLNSLTLHGWLGVKFDDKPPSLRLKLSSKSNVKFGNGNYFGNLLLRKPQIDSIQDNIGTYPYILFIPEIDTDGNDKGSIIYRIAFTKTDPKTFTNISKDDLPTDITTNPSPPRNNTE